MVTSHSVPRIPAFPFWGVGGGGGLSPLLDFQPIPPIYQLNYILAIGYRLPALSALQTP